MNCIQCDRPSHGICLFCGRAICKDHFTIDQRVVSLFVKPKDESKVLSLVVDKAIRCGLCQPIGELIEVPLKDPAS